MLKSSEQIKQLWIFLEKIKLFDPKVDTFSNMNFFSMLMSKLLHLVFHFYLKDTFSVREDKFLEDLKLCRIESENDDETKKLKIYKYKFIVLFFYLLKSLIQSFYSLKYV